MFCAMKEQREIDAECDVLERLLRVCRLLLRTCPVSGKAACTFVVLSIRLLMNSWTQYLCGRRKTNLRERHLDRARSKRHREP